MTTEDSTTPIHAFVRSDVVRSAFLAPLEASGWSIATLRDSTDLAALLRDAAYAVLVVDSSAAPPMPGPWVQGVFVGSGEAPEGLTARPFATPVGQLAADLRRMAFVAQLAALRAGRAHQARGFIEDVALRSCLAALVGRKSSGTIRFEGPRGAGCIYVREGRVIDVECAGLRGEEALARLLAWTEGSVHVAEGSVLGDALITRATDDVFAEAERMAASVSAALVLLPKPGVMLALERMLASRIVPNASPELEKLLSLVDGTRDVVAILDASPFDDASTARTLARFAQGGAIHAVGVASQAEEVGPPSVSLVARHTPMSLPQVTLQIDAPLIATNADAPVAAEPAPQAEPVSSVGASTPVGLFAAAVPPSATPASAAFERTPLTPGVEEVAAVQRARADADEGTPARRTPISVETPAKAALDAAFRKAAQESQAALAASESVAAPVRRSAPPPPVNDRAKRLVGGIAVAALALFAIVAVKSMLPESESAKAQAAPASAATPAPPAEAPRAAEPAEPAEVPSAAEAAEAVVADAAPEAPAPAPGAPAVTGAPAASAPAAPAASAPAAPPAWATAPKLPPGRLQKAKDFLDKGQFVSASVEAQAVVQGDPSQAEAWLVLGAAALGQDKTAEAKHFFGECVRRGRGSAVDECRHFMNQ